MDSLLRPNSSTRWKNQDAKGSVSGVILPVTGEDFGWENSSTRWMFWVAGEVLGGRIPPVTGGIGTFRRHVRGKIAPVTGGICPLG